MLQENKRIMSVNYISNYESMFACPICHKSMKVLESKSLICSNYHTFDFAKQGYINFTSHLVKTKYGKELFEARRKLITDGDFYEPLSQAITKIINEQFVKTNETISILDTGCGEGSHLSNICDIINSDFFKGVVGIGIDLSKEGIMDASKNYTNKIWVVSDLANTPFKSKQFDVILNILSPSNYAEFNRLMKSDGVVIKVVPQSGYLKKLREHLFTKPEKQNYTNVDTIEKFNKSFQFVDTLRLSYTRSLNKSLIEWLVQMTPLTWTATKERVESFLNKDSAQITVDLEILIGKQTI
ncbi:methyltransferase domain-containing protein [Neobacillus sp. MER 74]|uniref:putative RNA methyltransferase n=1 Tax=Neobacillus sp. MER 74 TaxID=2939566 RepID=UPI00203F5585|nr:methyltransferase domain-containing protein [Neobacillus sp. MER 74]MCM3118722.1 methyltransferase domain-containing protein [Neobacillus sp. MER 74]